MPLTSSPISPPPWNGRSTATTAHLFLSDRLIAKQDNIVIGPGSSVAGGDSIIWFFIHFENASQGHVACLLKIRSTQSRRAQMKKSLSLVVLSFAVFGCATLSECPETPIAANPETQITGAQSENVPGGTGTQIDNAGVRDHKQTLSETLSTEEVRRLQTMLKTVGFDPGRIDGAFGPKTKFAFLRMRSGCSGLNDLLQGSALERMAPSIESSGGDRSGAAKATQRKEEIRVIQVRLKDAGFNPGTVDGIAGPNTRAAVARFHSGCRALIAMPPAVFEVAASAEQGDMGSATAARNGMPADRVPGGGGEHSNFIVSNGAANNEPSANEIRRLQNRPKRFESLPASLDGDAGKKSEAALRRRDTTGANRSSPARSSSTIPTFQY